MIVREYGSYKLVCDICDKTLEFDTFDDALECCDNQDWRRKKINREWFNFCPDCEE